MKLSGIIVNTSPFFVLKFQEKNIHSKFSYGSQYADPLF